MRAMHWFVLRGNSGTITISISCMFVAVADGFTFGHGASGQDIGRDGSYATPRTDT